MYVKQRGGAHEAIIFVFVQCVFFGRGAKQPKEHGSEYVECKEEAPRGTRDKHNNMADSLLYQVH
jgi:hypothetical protein